MTLMPPSSMVFSQYYIPPAMAPHSYHLPDDHLQPPQHHPHHNQQQQQQQQSMQPPPSPSIPIDPALALYPPTYYPQYHNNQMPQQLSLGASLSSPSSQASETVSTPPTEQMSAFAGPSKRPASAATNDGGESSQKRMRADEDAAGDEPKTKPTRGSRACTVCRRLKMKCVGAEQGPPCKRCLAGNHECIFEESNRGKRSSNSSNRKHELLTRSLRKMERTLDTVLKSIGNPSIASGMISRSPSPGSPVVPALAPTPTSAFLQQTDPEHSAAAAQTSGTTPPARGSPKLHSLPDNALNPLGLLVEASLANRRAQAAGQEQKSGMTRPPQPMGVASDSYFKPGPMTILPLRRLFIERQVQPEMLTFTETREVVALFDIFFDHVNMHCNLFDRDFHTPSLVCSRSPFLLTTICAIASRHYAPRPELHAKLSDLARKLAFSVPAKGYKSVEIVQAYLLLSLWGCGPVERYEQDRTWLVLGLAIRMATDLNLHRKTTTASQPTEEGRARDREVHNRERTWLLCYALDRSASAQMGKPSSVREDHIIRNAVQWARTGALVTSGDVGIVCYVELQRILSRAIDLLYSDTNTTSGLLVDADYLVIVKTIDRQIENWYTTMYSSEWVEGFPNEYTRAVFRFYGSYAMLVVNSFGLQDALERTPTNIPHFFARVRGAATTVVTVVRDELAASGALKYAPDSHFVFGTYAVLSLLKLIRPEFPASLETEEDTLALVRSVADVFDGVAAGPLHTPALYSVFLRALLAARTEKAHPPPPPHDDADPAATNANHAHAKEDEFDAFAALGEFGFASEMGPVADMSVFPPTMAAAADEAAGGMLSMDSILSGGFWDNVLVPGYAGPMEGLSGGFVYGAGGSGFITPHFGATPAASGASSPVRGEDFGRVMGAAGF